MIEGKKQEEKKGVLMLLSRRAGNILHISHTGHDPEGRLAFRLFGGHSHPVAKQSQA
jgi:hypothetical protein